MSGAEGIPKSCNVLPVLNVASHYREKADILLGTERTYQMEVARRTCVTLKSHFRCLLVQKILERNNWRIYGTACSQWHAMSGSQRTMRSCLRRMEFECVVQSVTHSEQIVKCERGT